MGLPRLHIDGHAGTTGLRIRQWLAERDDLVVSTLAEDERKSEAARRKALAEADLAVLCLPDAAAAEAAAWAAESGTRVLDASSCHRTAAGWVYGLPELAPGQRNAIRGADRVSIPGCYPTGFLLLVRPLLDAGLVTPDAPLSIHGLSGYTGGGRALIERWEARGEVRGEVRERDLLGHRFEAPYALERIHKHVPEMHAHSGLAHAPQFLPAVGPFACGMRVQLPIHARLLAPAATPERLQETLASRYAGEPFVEVAPAAGGAPIDEPIDEWTLDPTALNDSNRIRLHVFPNPAGHVLLVALLDNLGKGASGAAIQALNLMLGLDETTGLPR